MKKYIICGEPTKLDCYDFCEKCFNTSIEELEKTYKKKGPPRPTKISMRPLAEGLLQVSQAKTIYTTKREIQSRSSEKEGNDIQAEISSPKEKKLENLDIVKVILVRDSGSHYREQPMKKPENAVSVAKKFLAGEDREIFITINLDHSLRINSIHVVAIGIVDMTLIHPREVFKAAILSNASRVILAHNHPSGNPEPSDDDNQITCRLFQCGDLLGIEVMDHIIIGDSKYSHCMKTLGKNKEKKIVWLKDKIEDDQEAD